MARHGIGTSRRSVWRRFGSIVATLAMVATGAVVIPTLAANAEGGQCVPGGGVTNTSTLGGTGASVYAGGNFTLTTGAELEGNLVVNGTATLSAGAGGTYNIGLVGAGSGLTPPAGSEIVRVGGDLNVTHTNVQIQGYGQSPGRAVVGGAVNGASGITAGSATGGLTHDVALGPFADWAATNYLTTVANRNLNNPANVAGTSEVTTYKTTSQPAGSSIPSGWDVPNTLVLTGTGGARNFFTVAASDLQKVGSIALAGTIGASDPVIISVTGGSATVAYDGVYADGGQQVMTTTRFGQAAKQILWVFPDATSVTFTGTGQVVGSVVAPKANVTMAAPGFNGRLWAGDSITQSYGGSEFHDFPFIGDTDFSDCNPPAGKTPGVTVTPPTCDVVTGAIDPTPVTGISYEVYQQSNGHWTEVTGGLNALAVGTYRVVATVSSGNTLTVPNGWTKGDQDGADTSNSTQAFKDVTLAAPTTGCEQTVTPQEVTFAEQCGTTVGTYFVPTVTGVEYKVGSDVVQGGTHNVTAAGTVTVTATPAKGYKFEGEQTRQWTKTFTATVCPQDVTPAEPTVIEQQCVAPGGDGKPTVTPVATPGVKYTSQTVTADGTGFQVTVTAEADGNYTLKEGNSWTFVGGVLTWTNHYNTPAPCPTEVIPAAATHVDQCDVTGDTYTITATPGVEYFVNDDTTATAAGIYPGSGEVKIVAKAASGYVLKSGAPTTWTFDFTDEPCDVTPDTLPSVNPVLCTDPANAGQLVWETVEYPAGPSTVTYSQADKSTTGDTKIVTVTATINDGENLVFGQAAKDAGWSVVGDGKSATYDVTLHRVDCRSDIDLVAPTVDSDVCTDSTAGTQVWQTITGLDDKGGVITYNWTAPSGTTTPLDVTITATITGTGFKFKSPLPNGWTRTDDTHATYTISLALVDCVKKVTPVTPVIDAATCTVQGGAADPTATKPTGTSFITYEEPTVSGTQAAGFVVTLVAKTTGIAEFDSTLGNTTSPDGHWTLSDSNHTATWTSATIAGVNCDITPDAPTVGTAQCDADGNWVAPAVTPADGSTGTNGVSYATTVTRDTTAGTVTFKVVATAPNGKSFPSSVGDTEVNGAKWSVNGQTATWQLTPTDTDCAKPATVTGVNATCDADSGTVTITDGLPTDTAAVAYTDWSAHVTGTVVTVSYKATAKTGYLLVVPTDKDRWSAVSGNSSAFSGTFTIAACDKNVEPVSVTGVTAQCDETTGTNSVPAGLPTGPAGVTYSEWTANVTGTSVHVTYKAKADAGYLLKVPAGDAHWSAVGADGSATFTGDFTIAACDKVETPGTPSFVWQCGLNGPELVATWTGGTADVKYGTVVNDSTTVSVVATVEAGHKFVDPLTNPTVGTWTRDNDRQATYSVPLADLNLGAAPDCTKTPATPQVDDVKCIAGVSTPPTPVFPADTANIHYGHKVSDNGYTVTLWAYAQNGVTLDKPSGWTEGKDDQGVDALVFTRTLPPLDCEIVPVTPSPACVASAPSLPLPADARTFVTYTVGAVTGGSALVTATITDGAHGFDADARAAGWTVDAANNAVATKQVAVPSGICPTTVTTPPTTSTPSTVTPAVDGTQCISVGSINELTVTTAERNGIVYTVRGNGSGKVTITATAKDGFELNVPAGWTRNGNSATITITPSSDGVICVAGESSVVPSASTSVTVVQPSVEVKGENNEIAYTGVNTIGLLSIALLLLGGGAIVLGFGTGRRTAKREH